MSLEKKNSIIIILYLYMEVLLNLVYPIFNNKQISNMGYIITAFLIIYALLINKGHITKKFIGLLIALLIYMTINLLLVSYKYFVSVEIFFILINCFLPLYIITLGKTDYEYLLEFWFKTAKILTLISPIYIILYSKSFIRYSDIGYYSHVNVLIIAYFLFIIRDIKLSNILLLLINICMGLLIGSRMFFASSIITSIAMILFISRKKDYKHYLCILISSVLIVAVIFNIKDILYYLQSIMNAYGLRSRNLTLFIAQLEGGSTDLISSGRDEIYKIVLDYINNRSGLPGGLAVTRYITGGRYYFSHNLFFDFILLLGTKGSIIFVIWFIYKNYKFFKTKKQDYYKFSLYFIAIMSFLTRSITGAYFVRDKFFLIAISTLIFHDNYLSKNWIKHISE